MADIIVKLVLLAPVLIKGDPINEALNKQVNVSSVFKDHDPKFGNDGDVTAFGERGFMHTDVNQSLAWWTLDLEREVQHPTVRIFFRKEARYRRNGAQLYTSQTPFSTYPGGQLCHTVTSTQNGTDIPDVLVLKTCTGSWRYLMMFTNTNNDNQGPILQFGELEVLVCPAGMYGQRCLKSCSSRHCLSAFSPCGINTWTCDGGCQAGWTTPDCSGNPENVALGKPVKVSSQYGDRPPTLAVDGDVTAVDPEEVMHTDSNQMFGWWSLDIEENVVYPIVKIYFRRDYKYRRNGVQVYTSQTPFSTYPGGQLCHTVTGRADGTDIPDILNIDDCTGPWRYLLVYTDTNNTEGGALLDFGEVEVWICPNETYGTNCDKLCSSRHCLSPSSPCGINTWTCDGGCQVGWTGADCSECMPGNYGPNCTKACSERRCESSTSECDVTGLCPGGCQPGWMSPDCTQECPSGKYSRNCSLECSERHCLTPSNDCHLETGICQDDCAAGWTGIDCIQGCSEGRYGANCVQYCVGRHCLASSSACDAGTGQCNGGCESGWSGLDCSTQCPAKAFGSDCTPCDSRHCRGESDCPADGTCSGGCGDGWTLSSCIQECSPGTYGRECVNVCGNCSNNDVCDHVTGECPKGCKTGWGGSQCTFLTYPVLAEVSPGDKAVPYVVGVVIGALAVLLIVGGIYVCLRRQGRLQWTAKTQDTDKQGHVDDVGGASEEPAAAQNTSPADNYDKISHSEHVATNTYEALEMKHYENI